ncbi:Uncharacterised protein [Mycobacteroides abscessus]|nr:hypothetical protein [Mycobacteroides abscessus]CPR79092.1 Uncharacterised protein [Mycobacteroides abscessus]CPR88259.1 Uncharacterised protein [Mycobacteroides abscessus]CPS43222.1 Uncharacterised protein [Mycobacteroides abscessus]CPV03004.1 Uncharacterised protein [Mycobacteroides abscessus]
MFAKLWPVFTAVAGGGITVGILIGWHLNAQLSTYGQEFDSRIEEGW